MPSALRKILLWTQDDPILDVAVLEENVTPTHIAVLDPEKVSLYRLQGGKWQQEQVLGIAHARPWPRDLRGRLIPGERSFAGRLSSRGDLPQRRWNARDV